MHGDSRQKKTEQNRSRPVKSVAALLPSDGFCFFPKPHAFTVATSNLEMSQQPAPKLVYSFPGENS
jgi:hypothetical protein